MNDRTERISQLSSALPSLFCSVLFCSVLFCSVEQLQGSGDRHGPQWGAGAKPLHERRVFPKPIFAENGRNAPKTAPQGRPWEGGSPTRTVMLWEMFG